MSGRVQLRVDQSSSLWVWTWRRQKVDVLAHLWSPNSEWEEISRGNCTMRHTQKQDTVFLYLGAYSKKYILKLKTILEVTCSTLLVLCIRNRDSEQGIISIGDCFGWDRGEDPDFLMPSPHAHPPSQQTPLRPDSGKQHLDALGIWQITSGLGSQYPLSPSSQQKQNGKVV